MNIEQKIIHDLGYNGSSYENFAAQDDIVKAIHLTKDYIISRLKEDKCKKCTYISDCPHNADECVFIDKDIYGNKNCKCIVRKTINEQINSYFK